LDGKNREKLLSHKISFDYFSSLFTTFGTQLNKMTAYHAYLIILIATAGGWLTTVLFLHLLFKPYYPFKLMGFSISGILPALQPGLAKDFAAAIVKNYLSKDEIAYKLSNPVLIHQLRPEIETHVDKFLQEKLPEAFPLLSKFMEDKTLSKFKEAFLSEVELIFPVMLKSYSEKLMSEWKPQQQIEEKLNAISIPLLKEMIEKHTSRQLKLFKLYGALGGAILGIIQCLLSFIILS